MAQITDLNVPPYFDDFDANKDYHQVLFKPGYPVQARELTTLQSILQNQIEKFGQHFFKEGAKVIPGNTGFNALYYAVELQNNYLGVPVSAYAEQLVGKKITGLTSGITAVVEQILFPDESERGNLTLYINYLASSSQNNSTLQFFDGEQLACSVDISSGLLGNQIIASGSPFATTITNNSTSIGSVFTITEGVYFIRGRFITVKNERLILDQYANKPNYRVGLYVSEEIITSVVDDTLNDNSKGFNNYAAPGADRLKITASLFKKSLDNFDDDNFVELATIENGSLRSKKVNTEYNFIAEEFARRTYDESGDYYVKPFMVSLKESLNDQRGNRGIYNVGQFTQGGETPSENLGLYHISPGKAFVKGYEVETISSTFLDTRKPRTTLSIDNESVKYNTGTTLQLNRVFGSPTIGIGNTYVLSLRNERVGYSSITAPGKEIGVARVYDFKLESGSYSTSNEKLNEWGISLYDVQTTTEITLNEPISLSVPTFIKGSNSGATAFLKSSVTNGTSLTLYQSSGNFVKNESFIFDGIQNTRIAIAVTSHSIEDVKSVYGIVGSANTFTADTVFSELFTVGVATVSQFNGGISTVTSTNQLFPGKIAKVGSLIQYSSPQYSVPVVARVTSINTNNNTATVVGIETVSGIAEGTLPSSLLNVTDLKIIGTKLNKAESNAFYTTFSKQNISNVDLTNASLTIRKSYTVNISGNQLSTNVLSGTNETFLPFDEERYSLIRSNGKTEILTSDKFAFINGGKELQIYNLGSNDTGATLVTTLTKIKPKSKIKLKNRVNSIVVDRSINEFSGVGGTTLNDGLIYGNYPYGTRVQDQNICLNTPDIIEIHAIYESANTQNPSAPTAVLSSISGPSTKTEDLIIGEKITGQSSGAIAIVAEKITDSQISFVPKNQNSFREGESILFEESKIQAVITTLANPSFNISNNFKYENGQNVNFYGYGKINRNENALAPTKKLKIYFSNGYYQSTDDGDITTAESYNTFNYSKEIQTVNNTRNTDLLDIRPRVSTYTLTEGSRSPFEFYGRTFNESGNSSSNILASDESIIASYSFYLGRIDRIYLTQDGKFQVVYGEPAENPQAPTSIDGAIEIATISLPAYLYNVQDASIKSLDHKRYRMIDIKKLEDRIKNLEYYTTLSLLETNTSNLFIPDSQGLNRFKSGFFVDNFTTFLAQEQSIPYKNSIDIQNKEARPRHYTTSIDLISGPVVNVDPTADLSTTPVEGINVRKTGDVITLDYAEIEWLKQSFATRSQSVTPFLISFWQGTIDLTPSTDTWVDTTKIEAKVTDVEGNFSEQLLIATEKFGVDPQTGMSPILWNSWETTWTGRETNLIEGRERKVSGGDGSWIGAGAQLRDRWGPNSASRNIFWRGNEAFELVGEAVLRDDILEIRDTGIESRTGNRTIVTPEFEQVSLGERVVSKNIVPYMRSRNIQFVSKKMKPLTQLYAFFDRVDVTKYCVPKLLEISMISGVFAVGETVIGKPQITGLGPNNPDSSASIKFRVAQSNHKEGAYNAPTNTFPFNPYTNQVLPSNYSSTSTILNIDTFSLSNEVQGEFSGWAETGMVLIGQTSGAQATITNLRLISDLSATLIGSFYIPNATTNTIHPRFETGTKIFTLVNSPINDQNSATTIAEEGYESAGTLETIQENILSVRNGRIQNKQEFDERATSRTSSTQIVSTVTSSSNFREVLVGWYDPLAQSFLVDNSQGVFLTRCDIFFSSKDDTDIPVTFQLRTMKDGYPTQKILPFSEVTLSPDDIVTSADGSLATSFVFQSPVYLQGNDTEYAICVASNSTKYSVFISRVGEPDLLTQTFISNQPYLGSLFKSQNASTWEASQWEDLKFTLYRADFIENGSVEFYSPQLSEGNDQIARLLPDSINLNSRKVRIGIGSTLNDSDLTLGNTILQAGTNASGNYVGNAGIATGSLRVINSGIGYTPSSGSLTFGNVNLVSITGSGRDATANITIENGVAVAATISSQGYGYQIGDVLGITTIGATSVGRNARFSLQAIQNINELIIDNIQGDFVISGVGNTVKFINNAGLTTNLNASSGGGVQISNINVISDGLHLVVDHKNHGMYSSNNKVVISGVTPDIKPTKLTLPYSFDSTGSLSVDNSSEFSIFENVGVGTTNSGYLLIGDEVIGFTTVSSGTIGGSIVRGTNPKTYPAGTPVYKYELGGISLRRINTTHDLNNVTVPNPITFDTYNLKIDTSINGVDRSTGASFAKLYANATKSSGGRNIRATQNIPFEVIAPMVQNMTVQGTSLSGKIRTVTGKSLSGNEIPFVDNGTEAVSLNRTNYLTSTRLICSKVNETDKLALLPGNKSLNLSLNLSTTDTYLSPVIDTQRVNVILTSNRVDSLITNYATDNRVNSIQEDPSSFQYVSKEISLETSATSLKIILSAHINTYCDIRALYAIGENPNFNPIFTLFPGYLNKDSLGRIINEEDSDGRSDVYVSESSIYGFSPTEIPYKEYTFSVDNLPSFKNYRVKIILTSTNQVYVPRIKDLRVISLA